MQEEAKTDSDLSRVAAALGPAVLPLVAALLFAAPSRAAAAPAEHAPALPPAARPQTAARPVPPLHVWPVAPLLVLTLAGATWAAPAGSSKGAGRRLLLFTAAAVPLAAVALVLCCRESPRPRVGPDWSPRRLCEEVRKAGLDYEAKETGPLGAWCLRAPGDMTPWEEIANGVPSKVFATPGRVRVLSVPGHAEPEGSVEEGRLRLGPLFLLGHPDDLRRVAGAVR